MKSKQHKIKALMPKYEVDAVLVLSPENFHYITGAACHQLTVSRCPGVAAAIVTADSNTTTQVIGMDFEVKAFQEKINCVIKKYDTWVGTKSWDEVVTNQCGQGQKAFKSFTGSLQVIADSLRETGLANKRIGIELDFIPFNYFKLLSAKLPDADFINISPLFIEARSVKTAEEIEIFRNITRIADEALAHASKYVKAGVSETELITLYRQQVMASGICVPSAWSGFLTGPNAGRLSLPTDRIIVPGDIIKFDGGVNCEFNFYTTDMSRAWILGKANKILLDLKDRLYEAQRLAINQIKPGVPINEIFSTGYNYVKEHLRCYERGHLGHSISMGPSTTEEPVISATNTRLLEPGMILCVEVPFYIREVGGFNIEDMVLVTDNGHEVLTHRTPHYL